MKIRTATCPACGAKIDIEGGIARSKCEYCGSTFLLEGDDAELNCEINRGEEFLRMEMYGEAEGVFSGILRSHPASYWARIGYVKAITHDFILFPGREQLGPYLNILEKEAGSLKKIEKGDEKNRTIERMKQYLQTVKCAFQKESKATNDAKGSLNNQIEELSKKRQKELEKEKKYTVLSGLFFVIAIACAAAAVVLFLMNAFGCMSGICSAENGHGLAACSQGLAECLINTKAICGFVLLAVASICSTIGTRIRKKLTGETESGLIDLNGKIKPLKKIIDDNNAIIAAIDRILQILG